MIGLKFIKIRLTSIEPCSAKSEILGIRPNLKRKIKIGFFY